ncbi:MAG: tRNA (adenosine(37)-N6)-threonylcarbamoyltransferase complex ATPase subunit type 1 TsaE [Gammaproteobacteria bacterium]|nr:tRNA (adenosine(37)-N6)-threonylcarbamoyltransferase complex ATPase subunit type 1 TsaE [Gammaproteobacteria bacterium]|tara:strand:+ start:4196 stop:4663 length:468 start_codon:yes stop_codon:yes gene_type:complete
MDSHYLSDEAATEAFGATLAQLLGNGGIVTLSGQLGAGKTTLIRGFLHALGHQGAVKSPTYTLVEPYELDGRPIMHFDLYRLGDPEELEYLGFRDYLDGSTLCLIEWPEKGKGYLPQADLALRLEVSAPGRTISMKANTDAGFALISALEAKISS